MTARRVAVREAEPADLRELAALEGSAFGEPWSQAGLAAFVRRPGALVLIAELRGRGRPQPADPPDAGGAAGGATAVAGYAVWAYAAEEAELLRLAVAPALRRGGLARELLDAGSERLAAAGCTTCFLEVRADNDAAIALYERCGFHRIGHRATYYRDGADALVYVASIDPARAVRSGPPRG